MQKADHFRDRLLAELTIGRHTLKEIVEVREQSHFRRTPKETAARLMEVSTKTQENGEAYALSQAMSAAAKVAAKPAQPKPVKAWHGSLTEDR